MQVEVLKGKDNNVLFMEAGSEFVDMLNRVLRQPLGSVAAAVSSPPNADSDNVQEQGLNTNPVSKLQISMEKLRPSLFIRPKMKETVVAKPTDLQQQLGLIDQKWTNQLTDNKSVSIISYGMNHMKDGSDRIVFSTTGNCWC